MQVKKHVKAEAFVLGIPQNRYDEPAAWVPIHPMIGPVWAAVTTDPDTERFPKYPLAPLYVFRPIKTNDNWFGQDRRSRASATTWYGQDRRCSDLPQWLR